MTAPPVESSASVGPSHHVYRPLPVDALPIKRTLLERRDTKAKRPVPGLETVFTVPAWHMLRIAPGTEAIRSTGPNLLADAAARRAGLGRQVLPVWRVNEDQIVCGLPRGARSGTRATQALDELVEYDLKARHDDPSQSALT